MELPITNSIIIAIAKLVDGVQVESRQPTHSDLDVQFKRARLIMFAPKIQGALVGKAKRVTAVLNWAIENDKKSGSRLIELLLSQIKGVGGFRECSQNFFGKVFCITKLEHISEGVFVLHRRQIIICRV